MINVKREREQQITYFVVIVCEGPMHGLKMTLNVQQYENLPFLDKDSGLKVSYLFLPCSL